VAPACLQCGYHRFGDSCPGILLLTGNKMLILDDMRLKGRSAAEASSLGRSLVFDAERHHFGSDSLVHGVFLGVGEARDSATGQEGPAIFLTE
jgi:hypothetical protein